VTVNGVAVDGSSTHSLPESAAAAVVTPGSSLIPAAHSSAVAVAERDGHSAASLVVLVVIDCIISVCLADPSPSPRSPSPLHFTSVQFNQVYRPLASKCVNLTA